MQVRLLHLWSEIEDNAYMCKMDNLNNSVRLSLCDNTLPKKVLSHVVLWKGGRGCSDVVLHKPLPGKCAQAARGTVKAAELKGDPSSLDLVVASCYNQ